MRTTGQGSPEAELTAESYIGTGYQRLLTFEVDGGGFSLFGQSPADVFLTAYGLMEFSDMAQVYPVDDALIERTAQWLLAQQGPDGTWGDTGYSEHWQIGAQVPTTAYIAWSLIEAGYRDDARVGRAIAYIREFAAQETDPYSLALAANTLAAYDAADGSTRALLARLHELRVVSGEQVYWQTEGTSYMGATGQSGSVETTALAAIAMLRADVHPDATSGALSFLVQSKDSWGTWSTTQATILSLKALLLAAEGGGRATEPATVRVSLNGEQAQEIAIDAGNADVVHLVVFDHDFAPSGNRVQIELVGGGNLMYQVMTRYYLPWDKVPPTPEQNELIGIELSYDRTALAVNDTVTAWVRVKLNRAGVVRMALVDLGVPPGFSVLSEDLDQLVLAGKIARYELTARQVIVYLEDLSSETPLEFSYRLRARLPLRAQVPPTVAYDYYNPTALTLRAPLEMQVAP